MNVSPNPRRRALVIAITACLFTLSSTAFAAPEAAAGPDPEASADAGSVDRLQGIEVTSAQPTGTELYLDEKRTSSVVIEGLGAQQIARTGDSNVATTLKRITGLSLIGGKYIYVRGLGERYSSVLLNGASVPSPDYTRRVVPLDLFPNDVLSGVIVQKSYSPDMPGEFGGGNVQLRTRDVPTKFFFKMSGGLGYIDGTTGKEGDRYAGGSRDGTGYDDGTRELPASLAAATANGAFLRPQTSLNPGGATQEQLQTLGRDLAGVGYGVYNKKIGPDTSFSASIGDGWKIGEDVRLGVVGAFRYSQSWERSEEQRNTYAASSAGLDRIGNLDVDVTERSIDASGFINVGLDIGNQHKIGLTSLLLRQTSDRVKISDGTVDNVDSRFTELKWTENQLRTNQMFGHHVFPTANYLELDWQFTKATAGRDEPNTRQYRFDYLTPTVREYSSRSDGNAQTFGRLSDDQNDYGFKAMLPFDWGDASRLALSAGAGRLTRDRDSAFRRYTFLLTPGTPLLGTPGFLEQPIDLILAPGNIRPDGFILRETTRATDNYSAEQTLKSGFFNADIDLEGKVRFALGARRENNDQQVTTFSIINATAPPIVATDRGSIWLPAASSTWRYSDNAQLRAGFSRTLSRPDFRELARAPFTDPELDIETLGNPDLETTRIRNLDLRWEYYWSDVDSMAVGAFHKKFDKPIEKLRVPGSSPLLELANAQSATVYGLELDATRNLAFLNDNGLIKTDLSSWQVGFNFTRLRSTVQLDPASASFQTNLSRSLQGQSPYIGNVQIGYTDVDAGREATLLLNRFGRRISEVGVQGQPDIYEESFNALDLSLKQRFATDWRLNLRLRNLLDPSVKYTQGGLSTRSYKKGREFLLSVEWRPGSGE